MKGKIIFFIFLLCANQITAQETAESAFRDLVSALAKGSFETALQACVVDESVQNLNYKNLVNSRKAFIMYDPIPPTTELYRQINRASRIEELARQFKYFCFGFSNNPDVQQYSTGITTQLTSQKQLEDFIADTDSTMIKNLVVKKVILINSAESTQKIYKTNMSIYGCTAIREGIALLELNEKFYAITFQAFRYKSDWKIFSLYSPTLGASSISAPELITEDEFKDVVDSLFF